MAVCRWYILVGLGMRSSLFLSTCKGLMKYQTKPNQTKNLSIKVSVPHVVLFPVKVFVTGHKDLSVYLKVWGNQTNLVSRSPVCESKWKVCCFLSWYWLIVWTVSGSRCIYRGLYQLIGGLQHVDSTQGHKSDGKKGGVLACRIFFYRLIRSQVPHAHIWPCMTYRCNPAFWYNLVMLRKYYAGF